MKFCPEYVSVFNNVQENKGASIFNRRGYFSDPALILMHELIHVLHGLYGIKVDDLPIVPNEKNFLCNLQMLYRQKNYIHLEDKIPAS